MDPTEDLKSSIIFVDPESKRGFTRLNIVSQNEEQKDILIQRQVSKSLITASSKHGNQQEVLIGH
jgi:hypothetical protein